MRHQTGNNGTDEKQLKFEPSLDVVREIIEGARGNPKAPNIIPICTTIPADILTPTLAYLKLTHT